MNTVNNFPSITNSRFNVRAGPAGLHFFNRITGTNILVDEIVPPTSMWSAAPRHVSVALTNSCDFKCPHCYAPKNPAILAFDRLTNWLVDLDSNGCIGVGFGGGEPTLYPRLAELCSYAAKMTNIAVTLTTHAHRLSDQLLNKIAGNLHFVRVSMDGVGQTYESIRCRPFDVLLERIAAIRRVVRFGINYLVNSKTVGDLDAAVLLAADHGASEFLLLPEEPLGRGDGIDNKTMITLRKWVDGYRGNVPLAISEGNADGFPICNPLKAEIGLSAFAHIDASGILKRTSYDTNGIPICDKGVMNALSKLNGNQNGG
ncbi:MAG: radical SAM protein [Candidatus Brocadia sp.]|nr:radical SAM protein [Candidatus Brocadia sp.]MDG6027401.1 radical SAM protein [Candidatus Brocadia sp.]